MGQVLLDPAGDRNELGAGLRERAQERIASDEELDRGDALLIVEVLRHYRERTSRLVRTCADLRVLEKLRGFVVTTTGLEQWCVLHGWTVDRVQRAMWEGGLLGGRPHGSSGKSPAGPLAHASP